MQKCTFKPNRHQGFFSIFNCTLCLIDYCLKHRMIPEVDWSTCQYNTRRDPAFGAQLFDITPLYSTENEDPVDPGRSATFTPNGIGWPVFLKEDPDYEFPIMMFTNFPDTLEARRRIHELTRFIRVNEAILSEVDRFWKENCTDPTVGLHMRATDYNLYEFAEVLGRPELRDKDPALLPRIIDFKLGAEEFLLEHPDAKLLVATDSATAFKALKFYSSLRNRIVRYPATFFHDRSTPSRRIIDNGGDGEKLAREILTEVLLLSRCTHFVSSYSNISAAVLVLNPEAKHNNVSAWLKK